jgi:protein TonB
MLLTSGLRAVASSIACSATWLAGLVAVLVASTASAQTAPPWQDAAPVRQTGVMLPTVIHEVRPNYTFDATRANIEGTVRLECVVRPDGTVGDVQVVRSLDGTYGLDEEAVKAARQWLFRPGTRNGEPVPVLISIEMTFRLKGTAPVTDSPVPLRWPEAFGTPGGSGSASNAEWTVLTHELADLRFRMAYPMEWKQIGSFAAGPLILGDGHDTALLIVHLDTADVSPPLSEPVARLRLQEYTSAMIRSLSESDLTKHAEYQPVAEGQVRLSNRIWIWTDLSVSDLAGLPFDGARWWRFMTLTGVRSVFVDCVVAHQRGATADFTALARTVGTTCAEILTRVSLEAR